MKKKEYISLFSIRDRVKKLSHPRHTPEQNEESRIQTNKLFCQKMINKLFRPHLWKKFINEKWKNFFQKLNAEKSCIFLKRNLSPSCCTKRSVLAIKIKIQKKTEKRWKKTTKFGLAYVQFYKTKLHRGEKRREYMNYQSEIAILNDFCTKRRLKDPKMKKLLEKSQQLTKKSRNMCQFWT